jgi:hypothetical protein
MKHSQPAGYDGLYENHGDDRRTGVVLQACPRLLAVVADRSTLTGARPRAFLAHIEHLRHDDGGRRRVLPRLADTPVRRRTGDGDGDQVDPPVERLCGEDLCFSRRVRHE